VHTFLLHLTLTSSQQKHQQKKSTPLLNHPSPNSSKHKLTLLFLKSPVRFQALKLELSFLPASVDSFKQLYRPAPKAHFNSFHTTNLQKNLTHVIHETKFESLLNVARTRYKAFQQLGRNRSLETTSARLLAITAPGASNWVNTIPSLPSHVLSDNHYQIAMRLRLGIQPVNVMQSVCGSCCVSLNTVVHPTCPSHLHKSQTQLKTAHQAWEAKRSKYKQLAEQQKAEFIPFAIESFGGLSHSARNLIQTIATFATDHLSGKEDIVTKINSAIVCAVQRVL
jgi:hypothetical protein